MEDTQNSMILARLSETPGEWVSLPELHRVSGAYAIHSRAANLRAAGHDIENRVERKGRSALSFYRLVPPQIPAQQLLAL